MTPGVFRIVSDHRNLEEQIERQMGCMTGFLQLFDRHQILAGKQFYSTKRLLSSSTAESSSPSEKSEMSAMPLVKGVPLFPSSPSPQGCPSSPENSVPTKSPRRHTLPLPVFQLKDGLKTSWKLREAPRLSLDSRASADAKGKLRSRESQTTPALFSGNQPDPSENGENQEKQRRSPSVVAKLMGLEVLPGACSREPPKKTELRRSSSESRVPRDMSQFNFHESSPMTSEDLFSPYHDYSETMPLDTKLESRRPPLVSLHRKSFFDSQEFFREPKRVGSLYGEIEKRLRLRGIEEPAKDLETLKQILEALQLKGLLHSKPPEREDDGGRRPRTSAFNDHSPIVIMKPAPKPSPRLQGSQHRTPPPRSISPSPESIPPTRSPRDRNLQSLSRQIPTSPESSSTSRAPSLSPARRKPLNAEGQRAPLPHRRIPPPNISPKPSPIKLGSTPAGSAPKNRRPTIDIPHKDKIHSPSEDSTPGLLLSGSSSIGSPSQFDFERPPEYSSGRSLLERCDKLLHSIAAITSTAEPVNPPTDRQPSPVSVLDSTFLSDDTLASPLPKRGINFNDQLADWDEDHWNNHPSSAPVSNSSSGAQAIETADDKGEDYAYVADVVRDSDLNYDAFAVIENRHHSSASSPLHRRLLFDTVIELVDRKRQLAPWDAFCRSIPAGGGTSLIKEVWEELRRIQEHDGAGDAMEVTRAVIRKDMAAPANGEQGWGVSGAEMSSAVLHIERQLFKDLVADTIRELADVACRCRRTATISRRKLCF
ncbi:hypothetical protein KSP39_PZI015417 [Platanthera zijinensis]|uniref:Protein LONGIFOLIA 1 n=1 Tax=Platanthera zijinensis TaxID=2320716 RepID=A0AAP0BA77_9ASPA